MRTRTPTENSEPSSPTGSELPGMWEPADLSDGWADTETSELAKARRACRTLGAIVDRQAVDICRIANEPMPESGDADYERAWSNAFAMAEKIERLTRERDSLRAQVDALESLLPAPIGVDGYCTCNGDAALATTCGIRSHRETARALRVRADSYWSDQRAMGYES